MELLFVFGLWDVLLVVGVVVGWGEVVDCVEQCVGFVFVWSFGVVYDQVIVIQLGVYFVFEVVWGVVQFVGFGLVVQWYVVEIVVQDEFVQVVQVFWVFVIGGQCCG